MFFVTNFVTLVTNLLTHVTNFVIRVTKFVTKNTYKIVKTFKEKGKNSLGIIRFVCAQKESPKGRALSATPFRGIFKECSDDVKGGGKLLYQKIPS